MLEQLHLQPGYEIGIDRNPTGMTVAFRFRTLLTVTNNSDIWITRLEEDEADS